MPTWKQTLYILWCVQFITNMATTLGLTFVPFFLQEDPILNVTDNAQRIFYTSLILAAPFFTTMFATPLWGWLSDRTGRKKQVVRAAMGLGLTQLLMGLAQSPEQLVAIRMVQGMISGVVAANLALLSSVTPEERQGQAISSLQSASPAGLIFGPVVGGVLTSVLGYRPVYWLFGGALMICAFLVWRLIKEDGPLQQSDAEPETLPAESAGLVPVVQESSALAPVVQKKSRWANPFRDLGQALGNTWRRPVLRQSFLILILGQMAWTNTQVIFAIYAGKLIKAWVHENHIPPAWWNEGMMFAAICMTLTGLLHFLMSMWWGRWHDEKRQHLTPAGAILTGASTFLLAFWPSWWLVCLARLGMGSGLGATTNLPYAQISSQISASERGKYIGLATSSTHLGKMIGLLAGGALAQFWGESGNFVLTASLYLLIALLAMRQESSPTP